MTPTFPTRACAECGRRESKDHLFLDYANLCLRCTNRAIKQKTMQSQTARAVQKKLLHARSHGNAVSRGGDIIIQMQLFPEPIKQKEER